MLGAIIGDIVGSRWEFNSTNNYDFELFSSENSFTDDTICTIAVADALLHKKRFGKTIHEWCRKYPHPKGGYGGRFRAWVMSDVPQPYGSFGNGSAMRVSSVAWFYDTLEEVREFGEKTAWCTHNHPEGIKGAGAVAVAIFTFLQMHKNQKEITDKDILKVVVAVANAYGYDLTFKIKDVQNKFDETCQGTVPVALWIIAQSNSFEDAIRKAVALGADADTLGAIVGGIAEAIWGIPDWMKKKALTYLPEEMKSILREFRDTAGRKAKTKKQKTPANLPQDDEQLQQHLVMMFWKLSYGNPNNSLNGQWTMPNKEIVATASSWQCEAMPTDDSVSSIDMNVYVEEEDMNELRKGHIPESQEDHWFMYCDEEYIRYYRSWTGMCAYEAHYHKVENGYTIDNLKINSALCQFGVNGDVPATALFRHLVTTEIGGDGFGTWNDYIEEWQKLFQAQSSKTAK